MQPLRITVVSTNAPHGAAAQEPIQQQPIDRMQVLPVALELLGSGAPVQEQPSESGAVQDIRRLPPEQREEESLTSSVARLALGPISDPNGLFGMMPQPLLLGFIESLHPQSRALLAQTSRMMRDSVRNSRALQTARIKNEPGLEDLLTSFCPQPLNAQNFDFITNTLLTTVVPNVLASLKSSPYVSDEEKGELLAHSPEAIVNSPSLLKTVLQAAYDDTLVSLVAAIQEQTHPLVFPATSSLREKVSASRNWLTSNGDSVTEVGPFSSFENIHKATCLPKEFCALQNLERLFLGNSLLTALPHEIGRLQNLKSFALNDNRLTALPSEIGRLLKLSVLILFGNQLTALPSEIGRLQELKSFDLAGNRLASLPSEIGRLQELKSFDLAGNRLASLPSEIGRLQKLMLLYLSGNQLITLPPEVGELRNLIELGLSGNQLITLPPEIGRLQNLISLFIDESLRSSVPEPLNSKTGF